MSLRERLAEGRPVALDGGLSTALEELGADLNDRLWTARALRDDPSLVIAAHKAFVAAGAEIVISASYQAPDDLLAESVRVARQAGVMVAASVAPYGASLAGGEEYTGDYEVPDGFHERRLRLLLTAEPDCIAVETQPRLDEAAAIVRLLEELDAPDAWVTFTCPDGERTARGGLKAARSGWTAACRPRSRSSAPTSTTGCGRRVRYATTPRWWSPPTRRSSPPARRS